MAEGFARSLAPSEVEVWSAGSAVGEINPYAVKVMEEIGVDLANHRSKAVDEVPKERVRTVITLCDEDVAASLNGEVERLHWPHSDPTKAQGEDPDKLAAFRKVRDQLRACLEVYFD